MLFLSLFVIYPNDRVQTRKMTDMKLISVCPCCNEMHGEVVADMSQSITDRTSGIKFPDDDGYINWLVLYPIRA